MIPTLVLIGDVGLTSVGNISGFELLRFEIRFGIFKLGGTWWRVEGTWVFQDWGLGRVLLGLIDGSIAGTLLTRA